MLIWKSWIIHIEFMIVVAWIQSHEVDSACVCVISQVCERVILREGRGVGIDTDALVCKLFVPPNEFIW